MNSKNRTLVVAIATVAAGIAAVAANAGDAVVRQQGNAFSPNAVNLSVGETVRFEWTGGNHTVTCGIACVPDDVFRAELNSLNPSFEWTIPAEAFGLDVYYFSESSCPQNGSMGGVIVVNPTPRCPDYNGDLLVDGADLAFLLSHWGTVGQAEIDSSPGVGGSDLAILLGHWGACSN
jgi:plastocyanin